MIMPRGGKLLSGDESVRLAIIDNVDKQKLLKHIADGLHADEISKQGRVKANARQRAKRK